VGHLGSTSCRLYPPALCPIVLANVIFIYLVVCSVRCLLLPLFCSGKLLRGASQGDADDYSIEDME
jgi:hypothetical protein